ncbi:hypothetical protein SNEBB_002254 [Seison nebaliae]|nr:hypothetical protein SNEBB_002254 [Seison nebaliae]
MNGKKNNGDWSVGTELRAIQHTWQIKHFDTYLNDVQGKPESHALYSAEVELNPATLSGGATKSGKNFRFRVVLYPRGRYDGEWVACFIENLSKRRVFKARLAVLDEAYNPKLVRETAPPVFEHGTGHHESSGAVSDSNYIISNDQHKRPRLFGTDKLFKRHSADCYVVKKCDRSLFISATIWIVSKCTTSIGGTNIPTSSLSSSRGNTFRSVSPSKRSGTMASLSSHQHNVAALPSAATNNSLVNHNTTGTNALAPSTGHPLITQSTSGCSSATVTDRRRSQFSFFWRLNDYQAIVSSAKNGRYIKSGVFEDPLEVDNANLWRLLLYPAGSKGHDSHMSLYLKLENEPKVFVKTLVEFSLFDENDELLVMKRAYFHFNRVCGKGFHQFFPITKIPESRYSIVCQVTTFGCPVNLKLYGELPLHLLYHNKTVDHEHMTDLLTSMAQLLNEMDLSDVTIKTQTADMKAHKIILASRSSVFKEMLKPDLMQKLDSLIDLSDTSVASVRSMLKYIYSGQVEIRPEIAVELYLLAAKFKINGLYTMCKEYLFANTDLDNVIDVLIAAHITRSQDLVESAWTILLHNKHLLDEQKWNRLKEYPDLLLQFVQKSDGEVNTITAAATKTLPSITATASSTVPRSISEAAGLEPRNRSISSKLATVTTTSAVRSKPTPQIAHPNISESEEERKQIVDNQGRPILTTDKCHTLEIRTVRDVVKTGQNEQEGTALTKALSIAADTHANNSSILAASA